MEIFRKKDGVVSVFLVIILVPCMFVSSLFVDLGKVSMSKAAAESAADLALNTLMTQYDYDLSEWYGLVASCQNIEEFYNVSADYFVRTMISQGMSDDEIKTVADYYAAATENDAIYDVLGVEVESDTEGIISEVEDANLANAALLKKQIVEFMKYRAPVKVVQSVVDRFNKPGLVKQLDDSDSEGDEELRNAKEELCNKEGEFTKAGYNTYKYLKEYTGYGLTNDAMVILLNSLTAYKTQYSELNDLMIKYLYNTGGLTVFGHTKKTFPVYAGTDGSLMIYSRKVKNDAGEWHYYIDAIYKESNYADLPSDEKNIVKNKNMLTYIKNVQSAITTFDTRKSEFVTALNTITYQEGTTDPIQYWIKVNNKMFEINSSTGVSYIEGLNNAAGELVKEYAILKATKDLEVGKEYEDASEDEPDTIKRLLGTAWPADIGEAGEEDTRKEWERCRDYYLSKAEGIQSKYLGDSLTDDGSDNYITLVKRIETLSANNIDKINPDTLTTSDGTVFNTKLNTLASEINNKKDEIDKYLATINIIINGDEEKGVQSLDELANIAGDYKTLYVDWEKKAEEKKEETALGKSEFEQVGSDFGKIREKITPEAVAELKTRVSNIKTQLETVKNSIESLKYGDESVINIKNADTMKEKAKAKMDAAGAIPYNISDINSYCTQRFNELWSESIGSINTTDNDYNMKMDPKFGTYNVKDVHMYLYTLFKEAGENEEKKAEEVESELEKSYSDEEEAADTSGVTGNKLVDYSLSNSEKSFGLGELAKSFIGVVSDIADGNIDDIRDDLYTAVYMLNMFSYFTYDKQGCYDLIAKDESKLNTLYNLNKDNYQTEYNKVKGTEGGTNEGLWLSTIAKNTYNKSLTGKLINTNNNHIYGAELEYILYGNEDNAENIQKAHSNIYAIRYGLNLISGYQNFFALKPDGNVTAETIDAIATALSVATMGIVPAVAIKIVLIPILTIFETNCDLRRLEAGFPVEIYKLKYDEWQCKVEAGKGISGFVTALKSFTGSFTNTEHAHNAGVFYYDYIMLFIVSGLQDDSISKDMYLRMAEIIQTNMEYQINATKADDSKVAYRLKNARLYFRLNAKISVSPLMTTLPIFSSMNNGLIGNDGWCTYDVNVIRGY